MSRDVKTARILTHSKILTYKLKKDTLPNGKASYSVFISISAIGKKPESCILTDVTNDAGTAKRIFKIFIKNTVTPCTALEVFDLLCEEGGAYYRG